MTPLSALLNEKEEAVDWLVDQHLPFEGLSLLVGKPKAGKSTFARCLAHAVAHGESFLGFSTPARTRLVLSV
jgi:KaiC/GvpD/RAD55 family RecA-like ATPase